MRPDLGALSSDLQEVQEHIEDAFYANLWLMMTESDRREITPEALDRLDAAPWFC